MMDNMNMKEGGMHGNVCRCPHHKVVPLTIVLFGVTFLLSALGTISCETRNIIWPILVIIGGGTKLFSGSCKCC